MNYSLMERSLRRVLLPSAVACAAMLTAGCAQDDVISPQRANESIAGPGVHRLVVVRPVLVSDELGNQRIVHEHQVVQLTPVREDEAVPPLDSR